MLKNVTPITEAERIVSIDVIRGFAILGIYLINMLSFHSPFLHIDPITWWDSQVDQVIYKFIDIFAQASFYPLFSMLFGYGLIILRERTVKKGLSFPIIAARRLVTLLVLGIVHAFLIWDGDILILYAVIGLLSLIFLRMSGKKLMLTGILLYTISNLLLSLLTFIIVMMNPEEPFNIADLSKADAAIEVYQNGTFSEITDQRISEWYEVYNLYSLPIMLFTFLPYLLFGAGVGKVGVLADVPKYKRKLLMTFIFLFPFGLLLKCLPYIMVHNYATDYMQDAFGGVMLAISYACAIALVMEKEKMKKFLLYLAPVGKLSMSNYLLQSIFTTFVFYSYGLGMYGKFSLAEGTILAISFFILQVILSHFWVKYFYYGPVEWLWRSVTYLHRPKMARNKFQ
ncbi:MULTISPECIES: DUF418 domain-containing protein [unclassified Bacillus (in: firmicutes)]|uniref:DUF418 domain-containing protein n=1 Tax=unclassified Bacillus (in: firmicutes) TaxID=185979 RepID=UPI0008F1FF58|nr:MULTISPECIES: DUF418 domain-containing protein [unclassified Bacillus (in: firmicutes)]SFA79425.1 uncharacterized protein SAMN02799634_101847 [Bacillus sp. UNCCL13]SFQ69429.1 uncharacterized protein SAMN04488577_1121 [Bacillus sp. cl95]